MGLQRAGHGLNDFQYRKHSLYIATWSYKLSLHRISQPWCYSHFGLDNSSLWGGSPGLGRMFSCIPALYKTLVAISCCDNQVCLWTLPNDPGWWGQELGRNYPF